MIPVKDGYPGTGPWPCCFCWRNTQWRSDIPDRGLNQVPCCLICALNKEWRAAFQVPGQRAYFDLAKARGVQVTPQ